MSVRLCVGGSEKISSTTQKTSGRGKFCSNTSHTMISLMGFVIGAKRSLQDPSSEVSRLEFHFFYEQKLRISPMGFVNSNKMGLEKTQTARSFLRSFSFGT